MKMQSKWKYYNHAIIPNVAPHIDIDTSIIDTDEIWDLFPDKHPLLVRYTTDFDCGYETDWWYIIKRDSFDLSKLNANRRYKITKGTRNFDVKIINPVEYASEMCNVVKEAYKSYPEKYRPKINDDDFVAKVKAFGSNKKVYGAFDRNTNELCAYAILSMYDNYVDIPVVKSIPSEEKKQVNAALIYGVLLDFNDKLSEEFYICDGERNISHETAFQDYLEKYFGFEKVYCYVNVKYKNYISWIVRVLFPFRKLIKLLDNNNLIHNVSSILYLEEIKRKCIKEKMINGEK